jgi:hypothetical protein
LHHAWQGEIRMVEDVEELTLKPQLHMFGQGKPFRQVEVTPEEIGSAQCVAAEVSELAILLAVAAIAGSGGHDLPTRLLLRSKRQTQPARGRSQRIWPHPNRALGTEWRAELHRSIPARKALRRRGMGLELIEGVCRPNRASIPVGANSDSMTLTVEQMSQARTAA